MRVASPRASQKIHLTTTKTTEKRVKRKDGKKHTRRPAAPSSGRPAKAAATSCYRIPSKLKLRPGVYELSVRATDTAGNVSAPVVVRVRLV